MRDFDSVYRTIHEAAHETWKGNLSQLEAAPYTLAVMRWHWRQSRLLQAAMLNYLDQMKACVGTCMDEEEVRKRPFYEFYRSAVEQFADKLERVRGTQLRDAAESSREVLQNERLLLAAVAWLSSTPHMERFARMAMESCAGQFRKAGHVVVLPEEDD